MAFIQKSTPPANQIITFSLPDFSGGLNNKSDLLSSNEASDLLNVSLVDNVLFEKRAGQKHYNNFQYDGKIIFIGEFKPYVDSDKLIVATVNKLYVDNVEIMTLNGFFKGINYKGKFFFTDNNNMYVYGKFPQTSTTYEKVIGTSNPNYTVMKITSPATGHPRLPTEHKSGVTQYDYTLAKVYYEPCENEFVDPYKGANVLPEKIKLLVSHKGRMYVSGNEADDDNVYINDISATYYYPVALPIQLPPNSDKIVGLIVHDDSVVIGRHEDIFYITGVTNNPTLSADPFALRRINTHTGFSSHDCMNVAHNYLFFFGGDGEAYALESIQGETRIVRSTMLTKKIDIFKSPLNITRENLENCSAVYFEGKWFVNMGDKVLIYSYESRSWIVHSSIDAKTFYAFDDLLVWGTSTGRIVEYDYETYLDFGEPYQAYWNSKLFDMDDSISYKQFKEFFIVAHTYQEYNSTINVLFEIDYSDVANRVSIKNQIAIWGKSHFGDRFITRAINETVPIIIGRRGRNIKFKISNGYYTDGEVDTVEDLEYYVGRGEGILVKVLEGNRYFLYTNRIWVEQFAVDLNQRMKIYKVNGDYELRGRR